MRVRNWQGKKIQDKISQVKSVFVSFTVFFWFLFDNILKNRFMQPNRHLDFHSKHFNFFFINPFISNINFIFICWFNSVEPKWIVFFAFYLNSTIFLKRFVSSLFIWSFKNKDILSSFKIVHESHGKAQRIKKQEKNELTNNEQNWNWLKTVFMYEKWCRCWRKYWQAETFGFQSRMLKRFVYFKLFFRCCICILYIKILSAQELSNINAHVVPFISLETHSGAPFSAYVYFIQSMIALLFPFFRFYIGEDIKEPIFHLAHFSSLF